MNNRARDKEEDNAAWLRATRFQVPRQLGRLTIGGAVRLVDAVFAIRICCLRGWSATVAHDMPPTACKVLKALDMALSLAKAALVVESFKSFYHPTKLPTPDQVLVFTNKIKEKVAGRE